MPRKRKSGVEASAAGGDSVNPEAEKSKTKKGKPVVEGIPSVEDLDFSSTATTKDGKKWNFKITSFNVNGMRAWVQKNGHSYLQAENADVICLQETKCNETNIPAEMVLPGYHHYWSSAEEKGYSGTGLLSKVEPINVSYGIGIEKHDNEGRVITAEFEKFYLVTAYVPNSGRGLVRLAYRQTEWDPDFRGYLKGLEGKKPVVLCGDLNVAHTEIDLKNAKSNKKSAGFTVEEREGLTQLLSLDFLDTFRHLYPEQTGAYTFWTFMANARAKDIGWRLDYFVISQVLKDNLCDTIIRKEVFGSDHCPLVCLLHI